MRKGKPTENAAAYYTERYWNKIVHLLHSKIGVPESISVDDIKTIVQDVYDMWNFYPPFGASVKGTKHRYGDEQAEEAFLTKIIEVINRIPERTPADEAYEAAAGRELRAVRARFDSMAENERNVYLERARRVLPPFCHDNPDAVLFAALELMLHDGAYDRAVK